MRDPHARVIRGTHQSGNAFAFFRYHSYHAVETALATWPSQHASRVTSAFV